ncbi:MAG: hypothetical protein QXH80_04375, partial [Candidatus Nanoarchaeia archaeon]
MENHFLEEKLGTKDVKFVGLYSLIDLQRRKIYTDPKTNEKRSEFRTKTISESKNIKILSYLTLSDIINIFYVKR